MATPRWFKYVEESDGNPRRRQTVQFSVVSGSSSSSASMNAAEDVNRRLRHGDEIYPQFRLILREELPLLDDNMAAFCGSIIDEARDKIAILRSRNRLPEIGVDLNSDSNLQMTQPAYTLEDVLELNDEARSDFNKFARDICWLEKILEITKLNLENSLFYQLEKILERHDSVREQEELILQSEQFNVNEIERLQLYQQSERKELLRQIQTATEDLGNTKDELNDGEVEAKAKFKFVTNWQKSRDEQNSMILKNKEAALKRKQAEMVKAYKTENRIHQEMLLYLDFSENEYRREIENWVDKYDVDLEEKEKSIFRMKFEVAKQREEKEKLLSEYNKRQQEMDAYKAEKLRKEKEAEELAKITQAATRIQSWWRGVMFRKGLGPFRRKKGKGKGKKTSGGGKNSAKKNKS